MKKLYYILPLMINEKKLSSLLPHQDMNIYRQLHFPDSDRHQEHLHLKQDAQKYSIQQELTIICSSTFYKRPICEIRFDELR